jgi:hypothetical protein
MPVTSSPTLARTQDIWNGTGALEFVKSVSVDGLESTVFTAHLEEQATRFLLSGAGYFSGIADNWYVYYKFIYLLMLACSRLTFFL